MKITRISPFSGKVNQMDLEITQEQVDAYLKGNLLVQQAFPNLTADEREFFKTGITPAEWDDMLGEESEE